MADQPNNNQQNQDDIADAQFAQVNPSENQAESTEETSRRNLEMLYDIPVSAQAELGRTEITVRELLDMTPGSVIELQRTAGESIDLLVNGVLIGKGDVVVVNDSFGLRITEIVSMEERLREISE